MAAGGGGTESPLYLHFLNRELVRSLARPLSPILTGRLILLADVISDRLLLSSLALLWESLVATGPYGEIVSSMQRLGHLHLISEFASINDFIASNQRLYAHDQLRYPMYFADIPPAMLALPPTVMKAASTTVALERRLLEFVDGDPNVILRVPAKDTKHLWASRVELQAGLADREGRAITLSLFTTQGIASPLHIGRLLSLMHIDHYLEFSGSDILTGAEGLGYFDVLSRHYPRYDVRIANTVLEMIGLGSRDRFTYANDLMLQRGNSNHRDFLDAYRRLVLGTAEAANSGDSDMAASILGTERALELLRGSGIEPRTAKTGAYEDYTICLHEMIIGLSRANVKFAMHDEEIRALGYVSTARLLLLVATTVERDSVIAALQTLEKRKNVSRSYIGVSTVFGLGVIGGVEILLAQSEAGTESPGGMTLTALDLIDVLAPDYVICLGIAYGLKREDQQLGEILVSTQLRLWDPRKVVSVAADETVIWRGDKVSASVMLIDRCRAATVDWNGEKVHFGLILSANTLVNSERLVNYLKTAEPDAIGGEMEGAGIYISSARRKVDWILVKGISDWGAGKDDSAQSLAARNAANFVMEVIKGGGLSLRLYRS